GAERSEKRPVQQGPPARVQNAGGPPSARNEVPQAYIFFIRNAAVLARPTDHLRLHPEGSRLGLGVPEGLSARARPHEAYRVELFPRLAAFGGGDPGEPPDIDFGGRAPFVGRGGRQRL